MQTTVTLGVEIQAEPDAVLALVRDAGRIPAWAPLFADQVVHEADDRWTASKDGRAFALRVAVNAEVRCVDYLRQVAPGKEGGAYLRVLPRPSGGAVVVMTLPVVGGATPEQLNDVLKDELEALARLARGPA